MINIIFVFIFVVSLFYAIISGRIDIVLNNLFQAPKASFFVFIDIYALLIFWGGMLEVAKESGLLKKITSFISIIIHPLFKKLDKNSLAMQYISMNFVANMLSMGSAATPFGLKAMEELNKLNNESDVASDEMITFLLINTSGLCFIPTILISLRSQALSNSPTLIIPYIIFVSSVVTFLAIILDIGVKKIGRH